MKQEIVTFGWDLAKNVLQVDMTTGNELDF